MWFPWEGAVFSWKMKKNSQTLHCIFKLATSPLGRATFWWLRHSNIPKAWELPKAMAVVFDKLSRRWFCSAQSATLPAIIDRRAMPSRRFSNRTCMYTCTSSAYTILKTPSVPKNCCRSLMHKQKSSWSRIDPCEITQIRHFNSV